MVHLPSFRNYTAWHHHANQRLYEAPADPWRQIHVDPTAPDQATIVSLLWGLGRVQGGDWDRPANCSELTETQMYDGLYQRFKQGRDWEETAYHDWVTETIETEGHFRGYEDIDTVVEERYPAVDDLYERICEDGYRANHGHVYNDPESIEQIHELDPMVLIGRSGEIIWTEGFHRLYLARFAGIDTIPVYVLQRHVEWQSLRDRVAAASNNEPRTELTQYPDHLDLQDVLA